MEFSSLCSFTELLLNRLLMFCQEDKLFLSLPHLQARQQFGIIVLSSRIYLGLFLGSQRSSDVDQRYLSKALLLLNRRVFGF